MIRSESKVDEPDSGIAAIADENSDWSSETYLIYQTKPNNHARLYPLVPPYVKNFSNSSHLTQQYTPYNQQQHTCNSRSDQISSVQAIIVAFLFKVITRIMALITRSNKACYKY